MSFKEINENTVEQAETVMKTNYYGAKLLTEALLPLFRRCSRTTSRILNITSRLGSIKVRCVYAFHKIRLHESVD